MKTAGSAHSLAVRTRSVILFVCTNLHSHKKVVAHVSSTLPSAFTTILVFDGRSDAKRSATTSQTGLAVLITTIKPQHSSATANEASTSAAKGEFAALFGSGQGQAKGGDGRMRMSNSSVDTSLGLQVSHSHFCSHSVFMVETG